MKQACDTNKFNKNNENDNHFFIGKKYVIHAIVTLALWLPILNEMIENILYRRSAVAELFTIMNGYTLAVTLYQNVLESLQQNWCGISLHALLHRKRFNSDRDLKVIPATS